MKATTTKIYYDYQFKTDSGLYIGEKLARSPKHAESMKTRYEQKYGCNVSMTFLKKIGIRSGKVVFGW